MSQHLRILLPIYLLLISCHRIFNFPHNTAHNGATDDTEIVMIEEVVRYSDSGKNTTATLITLDEQLQQAEQNRVAATLTATDADPIDDDDDNSKSVLDTADDLIFLAKRPESQQHVKQQQQPSEQYHQIDLLTSDEEDSLTSASASAEHADTGAAEEDGGIPREIELHTENGRSNHSHVVTPPLDMSDFVSLIPAAEIKSIAANYYRNDPEVQRAYTFLSSRDFAALKQHIIEIPEMSAFLKYLNSSGLDVVGFLYTVTNLTSKPMEADVGVKATLSDGNEASAANEIDKNQYTTTATSAITTYTARQQHETATTPSVSKEQLYGLHGLVDSVLEILPQDEILATFFDKLESNEQFSKLVESISSPAFARILNNMENSVPLRNLIFTLHNNGIYITRIVDSLKAYFFLGTF